ncbi:MAG TPA: hypothetical protein PKG48_03210 [Bacteroidales bacterium]|nr:hypothetical protein [Bacteroidales bacterium]
MRSGLFGLLPGVAIGTPAGNICVEFPIHGRLDVYRQYRQKIEAAIQ